jgi:hypothetical protein
VFNSSGNNPTVGGLAHWPVSGGATFDGTTINMQTRYAPSSNPIVDNGTAYGIAYNFKIGFNYSVSIDLGYSSNPSGSTPRIDASLRTSLPSANDSDPTACGPVSASKYSSSFGSLIGFVLPTQTAIKTYPISASNFSVTTAQSYLIITVSKGASLGSIVNIAKIVITESVPAPSFSLVSSIPSIQCGSITPVTFTVNNGGNPTVTGHTWNLGSANNGWLYNGSAAPATITTGATVNAITLTPVCGSNLGNVSATVAANANSYNTNTSSVSVTQPILSINGNDAICSGTPAYFINNLPCNATVNWQASPVGIITITSPNDPQTTISKNIDGQVTLTATVSNVCGQTVVVTKTISVGIPSMSDGTFTKNGQLIPLAIYNSTNTLCQMVQSIVTGTWQSATSVVWTDPGYSHPSVWQDYGFNNTTKISTMKLHIYQTPGTGFWTVTGSNGCGSTAYYITFDAISCSGSDPCTYYRVSPNPSKTGDIVIISKPAPIECPPIDPLIARVNIYDQNGTLIQTKTNGKSNNTSLRMPTTTKGFVIVEIISGKHTEKHKIIVQ